MAFSQNPVLMTLENRDFRAKMVKTSPQSPHETGKGVQILSKIWPVYDGFMAKPWFMTKPCKTVPNTRSLGLRCANTCTRNHHFMEKYGFMENHRIYGNRRFPLYQMCMFSRPWPWCLAVFSIKRWFYRIFHKTGDFTVFSIKNGVFSETLLTFWISIQTYKGLRVLIYQKMWFLRP